MGITGCADAPDGHVPPLVVYVSVDEVLARQLLGAFTQDTGVQVLLVGDSEAFKSTGLAQRILSEQARPVADVFWSSEVVQVARLAHKGLLEPVLKGRAANWPTQWRDAEHRWHAFSPRPRVLAFDPDRIAAKDVPLTWDGMLAERFKGQVAIADPRFGTTGGHFTAMRQRMLDRGTPEAWDRFLQRLAGHAMQIRSGGNAATVDAVVRGEALLGLTDADDVRAARRRGLRVDMVVPRHDADEGGGAMLTPNAVAVVRGGPNAHNGHLLVNWLLGERAATMLASSTSANMPLQPSVQRAFEDLVIDDPLQVDFARVAMSHEAALSQVLEAIRPPGAF
jgi:iron(III) transport system substrate-binding protein